MEKTRPYWKVIVSLVFSLLTTVFVVGAGYWMIRFLMPFVIGWIVASIANPMVCWLDNKLKIKKKLGSAIMIVLVIGAVIGLLYLIGNLLVKEIGGLLSNLPQMYADVEREMTAIGEKMSGVLHMLPEGIRNGGATVVSGLEEAVSSWVSSMSEPTVTFAGELAKSIPHAVIGTFVAIISAYFFVADREQVLAWVKKVTPKAIYERLQMVVSNFKYAVGGYFKAQFKIMAIVGLILFVGLTILKVKYAIVLSIIIAFLDFLPFFGTGTAFVPWSIYTILIGDYKRAVFLVVLYATTQIVRQLIQPKLVGDGVGMNPLPTLLFIYIGYRLGGFLWMILAVPIGMILINMFKAGAFDYIMNDVKILVKGIKSLRE